MKQLSVLLTFVFLVLGAAEASAQRFKCRTRTATRPVIRFQKVCVQNFRGCCVQRTQPVIMQQTRTITRMSCNTCAQGVCQPTDTGTGTSASPAPVPPAPASPVPPAPASPEGASVTPSTQRIDNVTAPVKRATSQPEITKPIIELSAPPEAILPKPGTPFNKPKSSVG